MQSAVAGLSAPAGTERSSPELVLVDHELALDARRRLGVPEDTLARIQQDIARRRSTPLPTCETASASAPSPGRRAKTRRMARSKSLAIGGTVCACVVAALLGVNVNLRGTPANADPAKINDLAPATDTPPPIAAEPRTRPMPAPTAPRAAERRFAWAAVANASGYHVEFHRDGSRIFSMDTVSPHLVLPARWMHHGVSRTLSPGVYRWYVWPLLGARRQTQAIVQAELVVR